MPVTRKMTPLAFTAVHWSNQHRDTHLDLKKGVVVQKWDVNENGVEKAQLYMNCAGKLCGYACIGKKHRLFGKDFDKKKNWKAGVEITWQDYSEDETLYWVGFDCAHLYDDYNIKSQFDGDACRYAMHRLNVLVTQLARADARC